MQRHYHNAPISEAVIDFRVDLPAEVDMNVFERIASRKSDQLPNKSPLTSIEIGFQKDNESPLRVHSDEQAVGLRMQSKSGDRVLQIQVAGFTYSHMAPYTTFETFSSEAKGLWDAYIEETGATMITRTAIRVINKIILPANVTDVRDYVNCYPSNPGLKFADFETFFMQIQLAFMPKQDKKGIINVAHGHAVYPHGSELVLDIDLFVQRDVDATSEELWILLRELSEQKNQVFEACITDKTREIIS